MIISALRPICIGSGYSRIEPLEVPVVLNFEVSFFNNGHEQVLHYGYQEEEEHVHEELRIEEVLEFHCRVSIKECVASLN